MKNVGWGEVRHPWNHVMQIVRKENECMTCCAPGGKIKGFNPVIASMSHGG